MPKVLVVDDATGVHEMLRALFGTLGIDDEYCTNGAAALERYKQGGIDVILTDIRMEKMDGLTLARRLKQIDPAAVIILMTAFDRKDDVIAAIKIGVFDFFVKPFLVKEFSESMRRAFVQREANLLVESGQLEHARPSREKAAARESARSRNSDELTNERLKELQQRSRDVEVLKLKLEERESTLEERSLRLQAREEDLIERENSLEADQAQLEQRMRSVERLETQLRRREEALQTGASKEGAEGSRAPVKAKETPPPPASPAPANDAAAKEREASLDRREESLMEREALLAEREAFIEESENQLFEKGQRLQELEVSLEQQRDELQYSGGTTDVDLAPAVSGSGGNLSAEELAAFEERRAELDKQAEELREREERVKKREQGVRKSEALIRAREQFLKESESILFESEE